MKKMMGLSALVLMLIITGCASNNGATRYEGNSYNQIKEVLIGDVIEVRAAVVGDSGGGKLIGAIVGGVVGSTMGGGSGTRLTTTAGALAGGAAGNAANTKDAQELTVTLESGKTIVVVSKGTAIVVGDKVRIVKDGNKVAAVQKIGA